MLAARSSDPRYAVGLYRVSTAEQGHSGLGLKAQQASVRAFAAARVSKPSTFGAKPDGTSQARRRFHMKAAPPSTIPVRERR
jgi:hypothetical protein